ncbi:hypothetical protein STVA_41640 [Allostella vacuolata]|nr:hypothetical protein STVA_41640 [Stella vacuolata]
MTKLREPESEEEALLRCLDLLGRERAAAVAGVSAAHLYACSDPDRPERLPFHRAQALDQAVAAIGGAPPFLAVLARAAAGAPAPAIGFETAMLRVNVALGDAAEEWEAATRDRRISPRERARIRAALRKVGTASQALTQAGIADLATPAPRRRR